MARRFTVLVLIGVAMLAGRLPVPAASPLTSRTFACHPAPVPQGPARQPLRSLGWGELACACKAFLTPGPGSASALLSPPPHGLPTLVLSGSVVSSSPAPRPRMGG